MLRNDTYLLGGSTTQVPSTGTAPNLGVADACRPTAELSTQSAGLNKCQSWARSLEHSGGGLGDTSQEMRQESGAQ